MMLSQSKPTTHFNVIFNYGLVLPFEGLSPNTIALDGAVQGPLQDPVNRRFSLDHHGGCLRSVTLATCQQVLTLLQLGLVVDEQTVVLINDLDADTTLSVWLLQQARDGNSKLCWEPRILDLVQRIGLVDAHGPIFPRHPLHAALGPAHGDKTPQSTTMLLALLAVLDHWYQTGKEPVVAAPRPGRGYALRAGAARWEPVQTEDGFGALYRQGYLAAALVDDASEGSHTWTVGKRSDLVPLPLGPADGSKDRSGTWLPTVLGALAHAEVALGCPAAETWGGGSSIGGSPRRPGGVGSRLTEEQVVEVLNRFLI